MVSESDALSLSFVRVVRRGDVETAKAMLQENPRLCNARDPYTGGFPLATAVQYGIRDLVSILLFHGADPFFRKYNGETATEVAPIGNAEDVRACKKIVADMRASMEPPLWLKREERMFVLARKGSHVELKALLESSELDVNARDRFNGSTPLHVAAKSGSIETVSLLLMYGAEMNVRQRNSTITPLDAAVRSQGFQSVDEALESITKEFEMNWKRISKDRVHAYHKIAQMDARCNVIIFLMGRAFGVDVQFLVEMERVQADYDGIPIPYIVKECIRAGYHLPPEEGLMRIPPAQGELHQWLADFNSIANRPIFSDKVDRNVPDKVLSRFLRVLPSPLLSKSLVIALAACLGEGRIAQECYRQMAKMNEAEHDLLGYLMDYYRYLLSLEPITRMGSVALASMLAPILYPPCVTEDCIKETIRAIEVLLSAPKFISYSAKHPSSSLPSE